MPNTYTQIHIQAVFAVKYRIAAISKEWKDELYKFLEEYKNFLEEFSVDYDQRYIFKELE